MKVFTASLATETNTFSPMMTGRETWREEGYYPPGQHPDHPLLTTAPLWILRERAKKTNWQLVEGTCAWANPAGPTPKRAYEEMRDEILAQLKAAMPVDMVCMGLHGAMVAEGYDDCEGDILSRMRAIVGPKVAIGAELDPHCHMTRAMTESANILVCYKEFPHTDFMERGEEVVQLTTDTAQGKVKPVTSVFDCQMINSYPTSRQPMRGFVDKVQAMEGKNAILSISIVHCYPYADVPDIGTKILVITDNDKAKGDKLAEELGRELIAMRDQARPAFLSLDEAIDKAAAAKEGPIVCAEPADNAGGGAPSDSTFFIRRMMAKGMKNACIGPIWDPIAVKMCFAAGEGASFDLRFGGKMGPFSGDPLDAKVKVIKCVANAKQTSGNGTFDMGDCASIEVDGIAIVLTSIRHQAWGTDLFSNLGIDPTKRKLVAVKSTNHFYASFGKMAKDVLYTDGPGALPRDFMKVPYTRVKRPIWPLDANPWGTPRT
ncbi:MAG: M81 family metallopeptidase [Proteobacteria bacterium]|nr:M81 family metallopeptidase [Pseudomonadota bacterium]MBI3498680.1 M81 family metallopeptidase [Pseudomonadota bacterium]